MMVHLRLQRDAVARVHLSSGRENMRNYSKTFKSHVLDFEKKRKKRNKTYAQIQRPLNQSVLLIHNYRKSVPASHQHQTSCYVSLIMLAS